MNKRKYFRWNLKINPPSYVDRDLSKYTFAAYAYGSVGHKYPFFFKFLSYNIFFYDEKRHLGTFKYKKVENFNWTLSHVVIFREWIDIRFKHAK